MGVPLFDLTRQYNGLREEILKEIDSVLYDGHVILGPKVEEFEKELAKYLGTNYAVGVANGSDALYLAVQALGIGKGNKVITTTYTFFATASCITRNGAIPVFVDIDPETYNLDLNAVEKILKTEKISAIIPVHLFGQSVDFNDLLLLKEKFNVKIIEDCAQSIGSESKIGEKVLKTGNLGEISTISFFPTKNLGAYGDAGAVVTNDEELYKKVKILRQHGASKKYYHETVGINSRLDALHAAILKIKLKYLDSWIERRIEVAKSYQRFFEKFGVNIKYPKVEEKGYRYHVFHQYVVQFEDEKTRDKVENHLKEKEIGTAIYYPKPLHLQKCFEEYDYKEGDFLVAERASKTTLALPIFPELRDDEIEYVCKEIKNALDM